MSDICEHDTFKDICAVCHRDNVITRLTAENEALANDRDGYVQLLTDQNNALTARVKELEAMLRTTSDMNEVYEGRFQEMEAALGLYREAVRIDATMEGPKFMGSNASALKRAWDADRAAIILPLTETDDEPR